MQSVASPEERPFVTPVAEEEARTKKYKNLSQVPDI